MIEVNGYERVRLGKHEYIDSHLRSSPESRNRLSHGGVNDTPDRTPEQRAELLRRFGKFRRR